MVDECVSLERLCQEAIAFDSDVPAVEFEGQWSSRGTLNALARKIVAALAASGFGQNAVVVLAARNRPSTLAAFLALLARGCTVRMVYPFQSAEAMAAELSSIRPALAVVTEEDIAAPLVEALASESTALLALAKADAHWWTGLDRCHHPTDTSEPPQLVLLTSGTTGPPKPFALPFDVVARYYSGDARWRATPEEAKSAEQVGAVRDANPGRTPAFLYFPIGNISGLYTTLPALLTGQPVVLRDRFSIDAWLDFVRRFRPVVFGMPPAAYQTFLALNIDPEELSSIQAMGAGAAPLDPAIQAAFEARYGIPILMSYGATEFGGPVTRMTPQMHAAIGQRKPGTVGKAMEGMQIRIVDPSSGDVLAPGVEGVVEVVSCRIGPEWIRTSDLGVLDDDGYLFLRGRTDGAIVRGGFKILPTVIEAGLLKNPAVATPAVVGVADKRLGQVPAAAVVLKAGCHQTSEMLATDLRRHLPATHIPVHWRVVDALPMTPSCKIDIAGLRGLFTNDNG